MHRICLLAAVLLAGPAPAAAQSQPLETGTTAEFRAAFAPSADVLWGAGRAGMFIRSTDGGETFRADSVPGAADLFFTGVWALDADTAILLGTGFERSKARILRTTDGGATWSERFRDDRDGVFFDALGFWDDRRGIAFSDPVDGTFVVVVTDDGGVSWSQLDATMLPDPIEGEAGFAASGRALVTGPGGRAWFGTGGGERARVFFTTDYGASWAVADTPMPAGPSAGIFALAFRDSLHGVAVGGDHQDRFRFGHTIARTSDGGHNWSLVGRSLPPGVRYGVSYVPDAAELALVAVGPSGSGLSPDEGRSWVSLDELGWNTIVFAPSGPGWLLGPEGRIARWTPDP
jgi:photosystem II stability/assembly factor-like uncharacterized protein